MSKQSGGGGTQTVTSQQNLPQWVQNAGMTNVNAGFEAAQNMLGPYTGATYAGMTPGAYGDIALLQKGIGAGQPLYNAAADTFNGLTNFAMPQVNPGSIAQTDLSPYMNPFTGQVIGSGMQAIDLQRKQALNSNSDQAISQGAFGGSRHGVQEGVTNASAALGAGQLASQLESQNFTNAEQMAGQDIATNLAAQEANQGAAATGAGINLSAANGLAGVAGQSQQSLLQSIMAALQGQTMAQADQQGQLDANKNAYTAAQQFPLQQLQIPLQALGMTPYGSTTTQTSQLPSGNGLMSGLGAGIGTLGLLGSLFGGGGAFPLVGASSLLKAAT